MLIDCPACDRSYHVAREEIGAAGRAVICPRCQTEWLVDADGAPVNALTASAVSRRIETTAVSAAARPSLAKSTRPWLAAACVVVALMGVIGARERIVRSLPRLARVYAVVGLPVNVRGLEFSRVALARLEPQEVAISGEIRNVAERKVIVPRLVYEVRDDKGVSLMRWSERVPVRALPAGQTLPFIAAPHDVPQGAASVIVHFES